MVVNHVCSASTATKTKQRGADDGYTIMGRKRELSEAHHCQSKNHVVFRERCRFGKKKLAFKPTKPL